MGCCETARCHGRTPLYKEYSGGFCQLLGNVLCDAGSEDVVQFIMTTRSKAENLTGMHARWAHILSEYDFEIRHSIST
jgi:hypothetical protein